jgi:Aldo/keto reductases, related to diketogulonate reductase
MKCFKSVGCLSELGVGTFGAGGDFWSEHTGEDYLWISALRKAFDLGIRVVDTSELYGRGRSEVLIGIAGSDMDDLFIVTKIQPAEFTEDEVARRLYASRERLRRIPAVVMNHWIPVNSQLCDVVKSLEAAVKKGLASHYGLSNISARQLEAAFTCARKIEPAAMENRYSLMHRRDELDLLPLVQKLGLLYLAYSPLERGLLALDPYLASIGAKYGKTAAQVALNWLISVPNVVPVVRALRHVEENAGALGWRLDPRDWEEINKRFIHYRYG